MKGRRDEALVGLDWTEEDCFLRLSSLVRAALTFSR